MLYIPKIEAQRIFADYPFILQEIVKIEGDNVYIIFDNEKKAKSNEQNKLFHGLLTCFWRSGCSSFLSYDEMRLYYKRFAGLVKIKHINGLDDWTRLCLFRAIKVLPLSEQQQEKVYKLLRGEVEQELSWSTVSKKKAMEAITQLLCDMDEAAVISSAQGKKYSEILRGIGK